MRYHLLTTCAIAIMLWSATVATAQTFTIADGDVKGLIDALDDCNANAAQICTINLAGTGTYTLTAIYHGSTGLPSIESEIIINGNGATVQRSTVTGTPDFRIFRILSDGDLTIDHMVLRNGTRGAISNNGSLTVIDCIIRDNSSNGMGGAIRNSFGQVTILRSTLRNNLAQDIAIAGGGGAFANTGLGSEATIINSTISHNESWTAGGAIWNRFATLTMLNSTVNDNTSGSMTGAGINNSQGTMTMSNSIVANSSGGLGQDIGGSYTDDGYNLVHDGSGITHPTSISGNPNLSGFGFFGGKSQSHRPNQGSPVINAGDCSGNTVTVDQRGMPRQQGSGCDIGSYEVQVESDIPNGNVTLLRLMMNDARSAADPVTINLAQNGLYTLEIGTLPHVDTDVTIQGNGATIERDYAGGTSSFSIFSILGFGELTLLELTVQNGRSTHTHGGGMVRVPSNGTLHLVECTVRDNRSNPSLTTSVGSGAITNQGTLTIDRSVFYNNEAEASNGGAIVNWTGTMTMTNSTVSGNIAADKGGGIHNDLGNATIINSTITGNVASDYGGIHNDATLSLSNTIVAGNVNDDTNGAYDDDGYNIIGDGSGVTHATSMAGDPMLGPLDDNCGPTFTHALLPGSPALDAGNCSGGNVTEDQRGFTRPMGGGCDIGAYEMLTHSIANSDVNSLALALIDINGIGCARGRVNLASNGTYTLTSALPPIDAAVFIQGNGATIERSSAGTTPDFRILTVESSGDLTISEITIRNGSAPEDFFGEAHGGGILNNGALTVNRSTITGNSANSNFIASGGGIFHPGNSLSITNSTISGNTATALTFASGGGIASEGDDAVITNSTITANESMDGGGISGFGPLTLSNSIVALNTGGNIDGSYTDAGFNITSGDPDLGPLQDNGGPTHTHALLTGSPAIEAGDCAGGTITEDQRGVPRPQGSACDIGAYEVEVIPPACPADISGPADVPDGVVDVFDLLEVIANWGPCPSPPASCDADISGPADTADGVVDVFDLLEVIANWGPCP